MKRLLVTLVLVVLAAGLATGASAATHEAHGWWWRAQTGLLGAQVPPPGVPEDGLAIETTPDGPSAVSAVRYTLDEGEVEPVLVLTVADQQGDLAIQACGATQFWNPSRGGPWDERPTYDCGTAVDGTAADDGTTWRFELAPLLRDRELDVVLVPAPGAGRVTFEPPDDASLETEREGTGSQDFDPPPVSEFAPPASSDSSASGSSGTYSPPAFSGSGPSTASGPQTSGPAQAPAVAAPAQTGPEQPGPAAAPPAQVLDTAAPAAALPAGGNSTALGVILAAMALLIGFMLWREEAPASRRLGRFATGTAAAGGTAGTHEVGGLGRFARPRTGTPQPLR